MPWCLVAWDRLGIPRFMCRYWAYGVAWLRASEMGKFESFRVQAFPTKEAAEQEGVALVLTSGLPSGYGPVEVRPEKWETVDGTR